MHGKISVEMRERCVQQKRKQAIGDNLIKIEDRTKSKTRRKVAINLLGLLFLISSVFAGSASQKQYKSGGGGPGIKVKKAGPYNVPKSITLLLYNYEEMQACLAHVLNNIVMKHLIRVKEK
ncbi:Hypothetical predicted protein [Mytilus galloprovincialis]|uniref:Uncharacterized protein n=1 Tax=Mytilus galloprovincialis TaxID=29158 RepID=A0A8B6ED37_MYTGA|nr:Hypothetical predicted protein [Mytilus galloprovincialis]